MAARKTAKAGVRKVPAKARKPAARKSSDSPKRARAPKGTPTRKLRAKLAAIPKAKRPVAAPSTEPRGRGRPKDTPDVWTPAHIAEVADLLWAYTEATPCPLLAEFCYLNGVRRQRIFEFPELVEAKNYLQEKRAMYFDLAGRSLTRDDGPRGAFIIRALANVGAASMTEKTESFERVQSVNVYVPDNNRGDGLKPEKSGV
jgi:hypothetical protein